MFYYFVYYKINLANQSSKSNSNTLLANTPVLGNTIKMASLDDIININEQHPAIVIETETNDSTTYHNILPNNVLFTFNEVEPIDGRVAYDGIYYLDSSNTFIPTRSYGKYILKNHQLTTLHYMIELEKMLFDVRRIMKNPELEDVSLDVISSHYTNIGVLCDKVGAGKSYCVMALLNEAKHFHIKQLPFRKATWGCSEIKNEFIRLDTNILLVPHSLVGQWKKYLESSGLKFYTIQKAQDIFGLADARCGFKGTKFSMITKEDDETVSLDDGDEYLEASADDGANVEGLTKATSSKSKKPSSRAAKTKQVALTTKASDKAASEKAASDTTSIKKKGVITKRSKADIAAITSDKTKQELEQQPQLEPTAKSDIEKKAANRELEKEKKKLNTKLTALMSLSNAKYSELSRTNYGSPERLVVQAEYDSIKTEYSKLEKQIDNIAKQIKNNDLAVGAIKITDIQRLHQAFECNTINQLDDSLQTFIETFGYLDKRAAESNDVILVSATFWNLFALYLNRDKYTVNRIIIDECNAIKGHRMVEVHRGFTWLITSSIQSMMTSSGYIWKQVRQSNGYYHNSRERTINSTGFIMNMIKELYENKYDNYKIYLINRPDYVEASMTLPELKIILVISKDNANIQVLQGIVSHDVLKMLNAGDIAGIITKLDVAVGDESNVIEMVTRKYQDDIKVKEYELRVAIENPRYNPENESISITNKRDAIADLKRKIACIEERVKEVVNCPICYDDFTNPAITPCCSNKFCLNCIVAALSSKSVCPMCKSELVMKNLLVISDKTKAKIAGAHKDKELQKKKSATAAIDKKGNSYDERLEELRIRAPDSSKYENMDKIFSINAENTVRKYLIFTEYESTLNSKITSILDKYGLTYSRIRGTGTSITNMVQTYHQADDKINVLLINSKYFGSGLNLENTSDIIILHKMQADIEMQVIGRAHRYGRKESLRVWKLYYQNEAA